MKEIINRFYVYEWYNVETNIPFYIGKGSYNRMYETKRRNKYFISYYSNHICKVRKIHDNLSEDEAFIKEYETILYYLNKGIKLTNISLGNFGGRSHTIEELDKISKASKLHWKNETYRLKTIKSMSHPKRDTSNMKKAQNNEYNKLKQRLSHLGQIPYNKGIKMSEDYCINLKKALNKPETKLKMSLNNNSNKKLLVIDINSNLEYEFYNIQDFINRQSIIQNNYKDKRNLWKYIRNHNYKYDNFIFKVI